MIPPLFGSFINSEFFRETIPMPLKCASNGLNDIFECLLRLNVVGIDLLNFICIPADKISLLIAIFGDCPSFYVDVLVVNRDCNIERGMVGWVSDFRKDAVVVEARVITS